jgi:cytoskeletal protein CcmA (bactofilin family)
MKRMFAAIAVAAVLVLPTAALAFGAQGERTVTVPKGETRSGTFYAAGQVITVDGDIDGDLICAGNTVSVNGTVHGDVLCAGQTITINGTVDGSVRLAGQVVDINGQVGRNGMIASQSLTLGSSARIAGDLGLAGQTANLNGPVAKDVYGFADSLALGSTAGGVNVTTSDLTMASDARVQGDLKYVSSNTFNLDHSKIGGNVERTAAPDIRGKVQENAARAELGLRLYWMVASLIVGLAFALLAPRMVQRVTKIMRKRPGGSIGWGLIVTLLGPILALLLAVTILGAPLALLVAVVWAIVVSTSGIFAGIAAGEWFVERAEWRRGPLLMATAIGVPLGAIIFSIPVLGWLIGLVATWWAVGAIALAAKQARA